ncbi:hypothetical protein ACFRQP_24720, partial [Kitasatospora sp. NPDC056789]
QAAVARALGKSRAWVGQRLALLHLSPELQEQAALRAPAPGGRRSGAIGGARGPGQAFQAPQ